MEQVLAELLSRLLVIGETHGEVYDTEVRRQRAGTARVHDPDARLLVARRFPALCSEEDVAWSKRQHWREVHLLQCERSATTEGLSTFYND